MRADKLYLNTTGPQAIHQVSQRIGNAVNFRGKGFCHYGDPLKGGLTHKASLVNCLSDTLRMLCDSYLAAP